MTQNRYQPHDGFRSRPAAMAAAEDVRIALPGHDVRVRSVPDDELPYQVQTRERAPEYEGWSNQATWHAALIIHNDEPLYSATHGPARLAVVRERPWNVARWKIELRASWQQVSAELRRDTAKMPGAIDWLEIAASCADEIRE